MVTYPMPAWLNHNFILQAFFLLYLIVGVSPVPANAKIMEYTDNKYNYSFKFPSDWKAQEIVGRDEFGEIRVLLQGPRASSLMVLVDSLGKGRKISKAHFNKNPNRRAFIAQMINFTVDQIYRTTSKRMNAQRMIVVEKQIRPSEAGIKFYISTVHFIDDIPLGVAGIHTIPFDKDHIIGFIMSSILDSRTMEENETFKHIFNSFRLIGEKPVAPPTVMGGILDQVATRIPVVGDLRWKYNLSRPLNSNLYLWLPLGLLIVLAVGFAKGRIRRRG